MLAFTFYFSLAHGPFVISSSLVFIRRYFWDCNERDPIHTSWVFLSYDSFYWMPQWKQRWVRNDLSLKGVSTNRCLRRKWEEDVRKSFQSRWFNRQSHMLLICIFCMTSFFFGWLSIIFATQTWYSFCGTWSLNNHYIVAIYHFRFSEVHSCYTTTITYKSSTGQKESWRSEISLRTWE